MIRMKMSAYIERCHLKTIYRKCYDKSDKNGKGVLGLKNKIVILITGLAALNMSAAAAQSQTDEYMSAKYDVGNRTLTVDADLKEGKKTFLNIVVLPEGAELNQQEIKENESVIIKTVQTDVTGEITPEIVIPEQMQGKRFICYINTTQTDTKYRFSTVTLTELQTAVSKINSRDIVKAEDIEGIIKSDFVEIGFSSILSSKLMSIGFINCSEFPAILIS